MLDGLLVNKPCATLKAPVEGRKAREFPGDLSARATPVPIPNTEVKPRSDGSSWSEGACEISASPGYISKAGPPIRESGEGALAVFMGGEFPEKSLERSHTQRSCGVKIKEPAEGKRT